MIAIETQPAVDLDPHAILKTFCASGADCGPERARVIADALDDLPHTEIGFDDGMNRGMNIVLRPCGHVRTLLIAHFDRVHGSPGANDNGASVAELVSAAREAWTSKSQTMIAFVDSEEPANCKCGLAAGSRALARQLKNEGRMPQHVIVFDVCGRGDTLVAGRGRDPFVSTLNLIYAATGRGTVPMELLDLPLSDDISFDGAVLVSTLPGKELKGNRPTWSRIHSSKDKLESISPRTLMMMQRVMEKLIA
jgi:hypothetical protein